MTRFVAALRAFWRPGLSRGWPGALLLGDGTAVVLHDLRDEVFFDAGMSLKLSRCTGESRVVAVGTFDRRKGRREAFADAWAGRT